MPVLEGDFNWQQGLIWKVGFFDTTELKLNPKLGQLHLSHALVDTGADVTCISQQLAKDLKLEPSGKINMNSASGITEVNTYDVIPVLILSETVDLQGVTKGGEIAAFKSVNAVEFSAINKGYNALIGRDILSTGVLVISPEGHYTFSF